MLFTDKLKTMNNLNSVSDDILAESYYENCLKEIYLRFIKVIYIIKVKKKKKILRF